MPPDSCVLVPHGQALETLLDLEKVPGDVTSVNYLKAGMWEEGNLFRSTP